MLVIGLILAGYGFLMDASVSSNYISDRIKNIGLSNDKQNFIIAGSALSLIEIILYVGGVIEKQLKAVNSNIINEFHHNYNGITKPNSEVKTLV